MSTTTPTNRVHITMNLQPLFLDRDQAAAALGLGLSTFMREVRIGNIPPARSISPKRVGWLLTELQEFAATRPVADNLPPPNTGNRKSADDA